LEISRCVNAMKFSGSQFDPWYCKRRISGSSKSIDSTRLSAAERFSANTKQTYAGLQSDPDVASPTRHWRGDACRTRVEHNQSTNTIQRTKCVILWGS